jgi:hypothetical protein
MHGELKKKLTAATLQPSYINVQQITQKDRTGDEKKGTEEKMGINHTTKERLG